jgi:hypothetical protein
MRKLLVATGLLVALVAGLGLTASCGVTTVGTYKPTSSATSKTANALQYIYDHATHVAGDSLICLARPYLEYLLDIASPSRIVHVDAYPGITLQQVDHALNWFKSQREAPPMAPSAVIALGGNDAEELGQFMWYVEGAIEQLAYPYPGRPDSPPVKHILWVNYYSQDPAQPGVNRAIDVQKNDMLKFVASLHPGLVTVLDWASFISRHPEWMRSDGVHYQDNGCGGEAIFIAQALAKAVPA